MKTIDAIIIHCSATRAGQDLRAKDIDRMHRARGLVAKLCKEYPIIEVLGHRDTSPDLDGSG